jgi:hypothetical protein
MGGGPTQATQEQQQANLTATENQNAFDTQLMALFNKQYASQTSTLQYLQGQVKPIVAQSEAGEGMSPAALTAMRTSATDSISSEYQSAQQALNEQEAGQMGGTNILPSGTRSQLTAGLLSSEAQTKAGTNNQITQYNQNLATSNLWNAFNVLSGTAAQMSPLGYASSATSGSGVIAGLSGAQSSLQNSITTANNSGFFGSLANSFGSSLGQGFGFDPQQQFG